MDIMAMNIQNEIAIGSEMGRLLNIKQRMGTVGGAIPSSGLTTLEYVPSVAYDALILVLNAAPANGFRYG